MSSCTAIESRDTSEYAPVRFIRYEKSSTADRLLLAFDALVIGHVVGSLPSKGKLIRGPQFRSTTVPLPALVKVAHPILRRITSWSSTTPPPPLVLNKVLRCLVWVETASGGQAEIQLSGDEIDDGGEVSKGAITASLCLGGLYEAVDALDETIGDLAMEPA